VKQLVVNNLRKQNIIFIYYLLSQVLKRSQLGKNKLLTYIYTT